MKTAQKWMVATGAGLVLVALVILLSGGLNARPEKDPTTAAGVGTQAPQASHPLPPAWQLSWQGSPPATGLDQPMLPSASNPLDNLKPPVFRANPTGDLVMDPQTRTDVERLHALNERDDALAKLEALSRNLPAQARRELKELYQQHAQYSQAVTRSFPLGSRSILSTRYFNNWKACTNCACNTLAQIEPKNCLVKKSRPREKCWP